MKKLRRKNINFILAQRHQQNHLSYPTLYKIGLCLLPVIIILVLSGQYILQLKQLNLAEAEKLQIQEYLDSQAALGQLQEELQYEEKLEAAKNQEENQKAWNSLKEKTGVMTSLQLEAVYRAQNEQTRIEKLVYDNGELELTGITNQYQEASGFASRLQESRAFETVIYSGFQKTDAGTYEFQIKAVIAPREEKG